jgi:hypothetical protein
MFILNSTVLLEKVSLEPFIHLCKGILSAEYLVYPSKLFVVRQELQEGISSVCLQFTFESLLALDTFQNQEFDIFINKLSLSTGIRIDYFSTTLEEL